ncbi:probable UDP-3-O-acyl-N-acetylglucosamine deacetylase 1, mitochondrial isoform X2 [Cryptomeria japonica]|uniref:probable UDP-3-O-acyl-N-acetylglucosamine deacetylase 1, mitochondrial isoform X2 n=1 Tax=Cryptomeria japonica TaxID=3369 RepID=UPI0027DA1F1E|nr:probable UDP-3-O-acyl-N-acetylglucosamine deacetylase 1, mitochondrial isoform X2 [Cryptomeria japonica]
MARVSKFSTAMQFVYSKYLSTARSFTVAAQEPILPVKSCAFSPKVAWKRTGQLQRTISRGFSKAGVGLHSGDEAVVRVLPAMAGEGRYFIIGKCRVRVPASTIHLSDTTLSVHIGKGGTSVRTVEHLLSALEGMGIDNCRIEIEGANEVPILDGSALEWVEAIEEAGTCIAKNNFGMDVEKMALIVCEPFHVMKGESFVAVYPAASTRITYGIDFQQAPAIGCQWFSWSPVDSMTYKEKVAPSRTFGLYEQVEQLRTAGLIKGGSIDNALVCSITKGWVNPPLRFSDEPCRHKILDLVGDLSLCAQDGHQGLPIAHIIAFKITNGAQESFKRKEASR